MSASKYSILFFTCNGFLSLIVYLYSLCELANKQAAACPVLIKAACAEATMLIFHIYGCFQKVLPGETHHHCQLWLFLLFIYLTLHLLINSNYNPLSADLHTV